MGRQKDGGVLANQMANKPVSCWPCTDGDHKACQNSAGISLRSNSFICQCSCLETNQVSDHGHKTAVVGANGSVTGVMYGGGRVFMHGPGKVGL